MYEIIYYERIKVPKWRIDYFDKEYYEKLKEIKELIIIKLRENNSMEIDIKNNCKIKVN